MQIRGDIAAKTRRVVCVMSWREVSWLNEIKLKTVLKSHLG